MTNLDATCIAAPPTVADRATFISRGAKGAIEEVIDRRPIYLGDDHVLSV